MTEAKIEFISKAVPDWREDNRVAILIAHLSCHAHQLIS